MTIPVRFLRGTESPRYLRDSTAVAQAAIPHSDLVEVPGHAHMAMDSAPETFAELVIAFCSD